MSAPRSARANTGFHQSATTPPQTRKRKAADSPKISLPSTKHTKTVEFASAVFVTTPITNASNPPQAMDSDDEFMSGTSSQEEAFGYAQDSDDGSLGAFSYSSEYSPLKDCVCLIHSFLADFDDEDQDAGFSHEKDVIKTTRKPYEVEFQVLSPSDIQAQQDVQINEVASILEQPPEAAAILLRYMRWNKERLIESYMEQPEELLEAAGLGQNPAGPPKTLRMMSFSCDICCDDQELETFSMKCGHRYCVDCYRQYLQHKIKDEGEAARIQCPTSGCRRTVDSETLKLLVTSEVKSRYVYL